MNIKTIRIKNFKCLGPQEIFLDLSEQILVLIGENNVGKSSILSALSFFFSGRKTIPLEYFYNKICNLGNAIEITIEFNNLTPQEKEHKAIKPYFWNKDGEDVFILKKKYYYEGEKSDFKYISIKNTTEKNNPGGLATIVDDLFTYDKMQIVYIEAVKKVTDESIANTKSAFGQIFDMLVKEEVEGTSEFINLQKAFADYQKIFEGTTKLQKIKELELNVDTKLKRMIKVNSKISLTSPDLKDKIMPSPKLLTNDQRDIDIDPEHQGNGLQRSLIFSLLEILAEQKSPSKKLVGTKNLLLVEEPEIYMHPQMERKIADTLYDIARSGQAQVICTTHSPVFIKIAEKQLALARLIRHIDNRLQVIQKNNIFTGSDAEKLKKEIKMITNFDPAVNEAFFAKRVVLVEGDTEIAVFREAGDLMNLFDTSETLHTKRDTTFVNCRGKWTINAFQEVLNAFEINYVVIHDIDDKGEEEGANGRILELLNGDASRRMMFDKKIETTLGLNETNEKNKPLKAIMRLRELHTAGDLENTIGSFVRFAYGI